MYVWVERKVHVKVAYRTVKRTKCFQNAFYSQRLRETVGVFKQSHDLQYRPLFSRA